MKVCYLLERILIDGGPVLMMILLLILDLLVIRVIYLRDSPQKLFYIIVVILLPVFGVLVYYTFTIWQRKNGNYMRMRLRRSIVQNHREEGIGHSAQKHDLRTSERIALLNKLILQDSVGSDAEYRQVYEQILSLADNRDKFLLDIAGCVHDSEPELFGFLKSRNLSEWEIGYCWLYLCGLTSAQIGKFLESKIYYRYNSRIRFKLGLSSHDTNLSIYLKNLFVNFKSKS